MRTMHVWALVVLVVLCGCVSQEAAATRHRLAAVLEARLDARSKDIRENVRKDFEKESRRRFDALEAQYVEELHAEGQTPEGAAALTRDYLVGLDRTREALEAEAVRVAPLSDDVELAARGVVLLNSMADDELAAAAGKDFLDADTKSVLVGMLADLVTQFAARAELAIPATKQWTAGGAEDASVAEEAIPE